VRERDPRAWPVSDLEAQTPQSASAESHGKTGLCDARRRQLASLAATQRHQARTADGTGFRESGELDRKLLRGSAQPRPPGIFGLGRKPGTRSATQGNSDYAGSEEHAGGTRLLYPP